MKRLNILRAKIVEVYGTYDDFSPVIKTDSSVISRVVCGRRALPPEKQKVWAKALKCKPDELFK